MFLTRTPASSSSLFYLVLCAVLSGLTVARRRSVTHIMHAYGYLILRCLKNNGCQQKTARVSQRGRLTENKKESLPITYLPERQAFSHLSRVSTYRAEIFPPSIGSISPKAGLIGWRVYSILPVSGFFLRTSFLSVTPRSSWY